MAWSAGRRRWAGAAGVGAALVGAGVAAGDQPGSREHDQLASSRMVAVQDGRFVRPSSSARVETLVSEEEAFSATYRDADVALVVNQILGEFLGLDFTIAPDVVGTVTLRASGIRSRSEAIALLRSALSPLGVAVLERGDFISVIRAVGAEEAVGDIIVIAPGETAPPGYDAAVITPRHIRPSVLAPLISSLVPSTAAISADDERRALIVSGGQDAVAAVAQAAALFDVDWFSQISSGMFPLSHVSAEDMAGELRPVLGLEAANVEIIPVPRLSSLVVLARSPRAFQLSSDWIARLDRPAVRSAARGLLVYDARYADAEMLVSTIERLLGLRAGAEAYSPASAEETMSGPRPAGGAISERGLVMAADPAQNSVIARGSDEELRDVQELLDAMDRPRAQVLIEAAIVEVTLTDELRHGVNWAGLIDDRLSLVFSDASSGDVISRFPGISISYVNPGIEAAINLLSSVTHVEIVSRPSVIALHNETAELQIGDQVPVITQSAVSVGDPAAPIVNQTIYRDTGVILSVTPRVRAGGTVEIEVAQEVSDVSVTTTSNIDSPTISQRRIASRLLVPSGEAVALGGLISSSRVNGSTGVPVLRRVPVAGALFRSDIRSEERTELIVFLTPRVLVSPYEAVDATIAMRDALGRLQARLDEI